MIVSFQKYCIYFLLLLQLVEAKRWTEDDERKRIAQIKAEERQQFRMEMGGDALGGGGNSWDGGRLYDDDVSGTGYGSRRIDYSGEMAPSYRPSQANYYKPRQPERPQIPDKKPIAMPSFAAVLRNTVIKGNQTVVEPVNWCFTCTSPLRILSEPMQQAVRNLLDVRRSELPKNVTVSDCHQPANIKTLPKQQCRHSYCQTLVLLEHERGVAFAMRGCAENFAAVNEAVLDARGDNECVKIHQKLELKECICKNRKYCYKGSTNDQIEAASEQVVLFPASLSSSPQIFSSYSFKMLLLFLSVCHLFL